MRYWNSIRKNSLVSELLHFGFGNILISISNFLLIIVISRSLGPTFYGRYTIIITTITFITTIITGWASIGNLRFYERYGNSLSNALLISSLWLAVFVVLIDIIIFGLRDNVDFPLGFILIFHLSEVFYGFIISEYRARNIKKVFFHIALLKLALPLILLFVLSHDSKLEWVFLITAVYNYLVILRYFYIRKVNFKNSLRFSEWKSVFKYGYIISISVLCVQVIALSDRFFLKYYFNEEVVGLYSASYRIAEMSILFISNQFLFAFYPHLIRLSERNESEQVRRSISTTVHIYYIVFIPIIILTFYYGREILGIFLGENYNKESPIIFGIISLGVLFYAHSQIIGKKLELTEQSSRILISYVIAGVINIFLNFLLIPTFSLLGAAIATTISYVSLLLLFYLMNKEKPLKSFKISHIFYTIALIILCHAIYNLVFLSSMVKLTLTAFIFIGVGSLIISKIIRQRID